MVVKSGCIPRVLHWSMCFQYFFSMDIVSRLVSSIVDVSIGQCSESSVIGTHLCGQIYVALAVVLSSRKKVLCLCSVFTQRIEFSIILLVDKIHRAVLHFKK